MRRLLTILAIISVVLVSIYIGISKLSLEYTLLPSDEMLVQKKHDGTLLPLSTASTNNSTSTQIDLGKEMFFKETFGNEVFFTDIMGIFEGPVTLKGITQAILALNGKGTSNLQVKAEENFQAGETKINKGDLINTGIDVAKDTYIPIGVKVVFDEGRLKAGISCALCHATVNQSGKVIAGAPNTDLNMGLILAMGSNTAAYFTHTEMESIKEFIKKDGKVIPGTQKEKLPDPDLLEQFVDQEIVKYPTGSVDTTIDFANNPVQTPDSYTFGDHPFGWSGQGQIGPFKGLSAAINNAHSQNMDALSQSEISEPVFHINKEVYMGTLLQRAASSKYRYDINSGIKPSEFFAQVDPTPNAPGVNRLIKAPTFPKISYMTSIGLFSSSDNYKAWEQVNAMSAYMNTLAPPATELKKDKATFEKGRSVFAKAGCISCHGGTYLTNNQLISTEEIKTDSSRAKGFHVTEHYFTKPVIFAPNTPVPLPKHPETIAVEMNDKEKQSLKKAWAHGNSSGVYKTPSLYGLYWSAPYLHDGGVAVGPSLELGIPNTLFKGIHPDPVNSLKALLDSKLRQKVIKANLENDQLSSAHVSGKGHDFYIDVTTGFTKEEQAAVIHYLLRVTD